MKKRFFSVLLCLCLLAGLAPNMGTTAFAAGDYKIGDTVNFAGYEWYIIGTETEGVTAPAGCYTLFAKNNDFGTSNYDGLKDYGTSNLAKAMEEIANKLPSDDKKTLSPAIRWGPPVHQPAMCSCGPSAQTSLMQLMKPCGNSMRSIGCAIVTLLP